MDSRKKLVGFEDRNKMVGKSKDNETKFFIDKNLNQYQRGWAALRTIFGSDRIPGPETMEATETIEIKGDLVGSFMGLEKEEIQFLGWWPATGAFLFYDKAVTKASFSVFPGENVQKVLNQTRENFRKK